MAINNNQAAQIAKPMWLCGLTGAAMGVIFSLILFAVMAAVMSFATIGEGIMRPFVIVVSVLACLISGFVAAKQSGGKGAVTGLVAGLFYILTLFIISALTITGFVFDTYLVIMLLIGVIAGASGGIIGVNMAAGRRYRR